jgi:hypothetical protein
MGEDMLASLSRGRSDGQAESLNFMCMLSLKLSFRGCKVPDLANCIMTFTTDSIHSSPTESLLLPALGQRLTEYHSIDIQVSLRQIIAVMVGLR